MSFAKFRLDVSAQWGREPIHGINIITDITRTTRWHCTCFRGSDSTMIPPAHPGPSWTGVAAIAAVTSFVVSGAINIAGWVVNHRLTLRRENLRDERAREEAAAAEEWACEKTEAATAVEKKLRDTQSAEWRNQFRGIVLGVRVEMARGQSPSEWYPTFEASISPMNKVVSQMPVSIDRGRREVIAAHVRELTTMPESQVVQNAQRVFDMLSELQELTGDIATTRPAL